MEICSKKYLFVLDKAKLKKSYNKYHKDHVVFTVSTKEIELLNGASKKLLKLRPGHHDKVRFDIDAMYPAQYNCYQTCINEGYSSSMCTSGCSFLMP
jgi:hypothetical protein